jgi:hypothetical protein
VSVNCINDIPTATTIPSSIQYTPAKIGSGIDAKNAPNFPNMEKNIMKNVETCTTRLLPIRVRPRRPTFSLYISSR